MMLGTCKIESLKDNLNAQVNKYWSFPKWLKTSIFFAVCTIKQSASQTISKVAADMTNASTNKGDTPKTN